MSEDQQDFPKKFGEFEIGIRLGVGGMGQVFKARQASLDREVALKVLPAHSAQNQEMKERFFREARSAAKLVHPNVVQVYAVGEENNVPYFAMEYVRGADLAKRLEQGQQFSTSEILNIASSVVMALAAAEEHGIVHRDVKPGNIMIDEKGVVKVMDFGLAKATTTGVTNITQAGFVVGTPTYMSPEQGEGLEVDIRADLYSVGCVLYELITGRPPFVADNPVGMIYQHIHQEPQSPSELNPACPQELENITLKALEKKPAQRYAGPREMLKDLVLAHEKLAGGGAPSTILFNVADAKTVLTPALARDRTEPATTPRTRTVREERPTSVRVLRGAGGLNRGVKILLGLVILIIVGLIGLMIVVLSNQVTTPVAFSQLAANVPSGADATVAILERGGQSQVRQLKELDDEGLPIGTTLTVVVKKEDFQDWSKTFTVGNAPLTFADVKIELLPEAPEEPNVAKVLFSRLRDKLPPGAELELTIGTGADARVMNLETLRDENLKIDTPVRLVARVKGAREFVHELVVTRPVESFDSLVIRFEQPTLPILPLGRLRGWLRPKDEIVITTGDAGESRRYLGLNVSDLELTAGEVTFEIKRSGYQDKKVRVKHSLDGQDPPLTRDLFAMRPTPELVKWYEDGKAAWNARPPQLKLARENFEQVSKLAPDYQDVKQLLAHVETAIRERERKWDGLFDQALRLDRENNWEQARDMLRQIDAAYSKYADARRILQTVETYLHAVQKERDRTRSFLRRGQLDDARLYLEALKRIRAGDPEAQSLEQRIVQAAEDLAGAREAATRSSWDEAVKLFESYLAICKDHGDVGDELAAARRQAASMGKSARLASKIRGDIRTKNYRQALDRIPELIADEKALPESRRRATLLRLEAYQAYYQDGVDELLRALDRACEQNDVGQALARLSPKQPLYRSTAEIFRRFVASGARILKSTHTRGELTIPVLPNLDQTRRGDHSGEAVTQLVWTYELRLPYSSLKPLRATVRQEAHLEGVDRNGRLTWRINRLKTLAKSAVADPNIAPAVGERILAAVTNVNKDRTGKSEWVLLNKGARDGVKVGMTFNLYRDGEVVRLPLTGETLLIQETLVGVVRILRVDKGTSWAKIVQNTGGISIGNMAVEQTKKTAPVPPKFVKQLPPVTTEAFMGERVPIQFQVVNLDNRAVHYRWSAPRGGRVRVARTLTPVNEWIVPATARHDPYQVIVEVWTDEGRADGASVQIRSRGPNPQPPKALKPVAIISQSLKPYNTILGLAFSERNQPVILGGGGSRTRHLVVFNDSFTRKADTDAYRGRFARLAFRGKNVYLLDTKDNFVKRFLLEGKNTFKKGAQSEYGGRGDGNGKLELPVDFCLNDRGEILILDGSARRASVQVFNLKGEFLHSFGSPGGQLVKPVAICADSEDSVYVLDQKRRRVLVFRAGRFLSEFALPPSCKTPLDIDFCRATGRLCILDSNGRVFLHTVDSTHRMLGKFGGLEKKSAPLAPGTLVKPTQLVCDRTGYCYVIGGANYDRLDRFTTTGLFLGRFGGEVPDSFTKIAATRDGRLYVLDESSVIRRLAPGGWVTARFGGRGKGQGKFSQATDLDVDAAGNVYVLDAGQSRVKKFSSEGRWLVDIGKPGKPATGLRNPIDLAVRGQTVAVLLDYGKHNIHLYSTSGVRENIFPNGGELPAPQSLAVDDEGNIHAYRSRKKSIVTFTNRGQQSRAWSTRFKSELTDMAYVPGGLLYMVGKHGVEGLSIVNQSNVGRVDRKHALLNSPRDLGVDDFGNVYVLDVGTRQIVKFAPVR